MTTRNERERKKHQVTETAGNKRPKAAMRGTAATERFSKVDVTHGSC